MFVVLLSHHLPLIVARRCCCILVSQFSFEICSSQIALINMCDQEGNYMVQKVVHDKPYEKFPPTFNSFASSSCYLAIALSCHLAPPASHCGTGCHCYTQPPALARQCTQDQEKLCTRMKWSYTWYTSCECSMSSHFVRVELNMVVYLLLHQFVPRQKSHMVCHCPHHCYPQSGHILLPPAFQVTCW